ncbi:hypothetical protein JCM8202_006119 [Rhodotorula sphaerocarpa]
MESTRPERTEIGLLVVVVLKAQHLHDPHHFSKQDPFVEVEVSNSERARTRVNPDGGQQPAWDEEFRIPVFAVAGETEQFLHVRAMRQEREGDDELIGEAKVLLDGSWTEYDEWVAVKQDGKYRGEVYLELTWYPRQDTRPHAGTSDGTAAERLEEIRRREEEERSRRARLEREEAIRLQQAEARRQVQEARQQRLEQERLEAIRASQRAREARIRQEQEDAAIAARLAAEAEEAERLRIEARRAEDEALVQRLLEEEQAEEARQLWEREQADEAFVRQLREEDRRREEEERKAREDADAEFARKMREEEDAERRQRLEEDERIARSLAEQDETSRTGPMETTVP